MPYVDGFLLPVPTDKLEAYAKMAETAGKIWMEHGALAFRECAAEDMSAEGLLPFPKAIDAKEDETVFFSYIVFKDRQHRDEVNAKVMADPRLKDSCQEENLFDIKRMAYGGFQAIVDL
jgi:uncharacterized protein YbaA (DUF1428 family)